MIIPTGAVLGWINMAKPRAAIAVKNGTHEKCFAGLSLKRIVADTPNNRDEQISDSYIFSLEL